MREKVLGPNHPLTATSLSHLARLLHYQGDRAGALPMVERALAILRSRLTWTKDSARVTADALEALAAQRKRRRCGRSMG
jgi:Tetratricopeptide repeat